MSGRFGATSRRFGLRLADAIVTTRLIRWTWQGLAEQGYKGELPEFRPTDRDAVREMMSGRYLLASKLIETGGTSPFSIDVDFPDWWNNLQSFSWLRHFRDVRDPGEKLFARTLVLDWIGREGKFDPESWSLPLTGQRVLNWLRHLPLLLDGATPDQAKTLQRSLGTQVQSLRVRGKLATDPVDRLFAAMGILGAELCEPEDSADVEARLIQLDAALAEQLDEEGLHKSRNPRIQLNLLVELSSLRQAANRHGSPTFASLSNRIDRMHEALDAVTLSSGELAYFNGCGQVPHDVLVAVQANGPTPARRSRILGGYGILRSGRAVVIADSGLRPEPGFDAEAHAGALAFEFSHGSELILGSCGPAPSDMPETRDLFRQAIAHSSPTIEDEDAFVPPKGFRAKPPAVPDMELVPAEHMMAVSSIGYATRFGAEIERRLTLLGDGTTLVGQDRVIAEGTPEGQFSIRFHLAPGISVHAPVGEGMRRLTLPNGEVWSFLWEGATLRQDDSVRQSAYLGFNRTIQLVLEADLAPGVEVGWILTREHG
ncbi:heparinase II/III family protein [Devosia sp.]|uniref:heparinase II/III family protein n=1 Tax=Devosia sp. TaxID=1871048 RepID=UPI0025E34C35|nr:heparinase II/III family protein [Devosia sp.]MCR6635349.1 heparinase II/III family protein [Devosia sp.]